MRHWETNLILVAPNFKNKKSSLSLESGHCITFYVLQAINTWSWHLMFSQEKASVTNVHLFAFFIHFPSTLTNGLLHLCTISIKPNVFSTFPLSLSIFLTSEQTLTFLLSFNARLPSTLQHSCIANIDPNVIGTFITFLYMRPAWHNVHLLALSIAHCQSTFKVTFFHPHANL